MSYREEVKKINEQLKILQDFRTTAGNQIESLDKKVKELQASEKKKPAARKKKLTLSTP